MTENEKSVEDYTADVEQNNFIEGFPLSGAEVKNSKNKSFKVIEIPTYEEFIDRDTKETKLRMKLAIIFNDTKVSYFPNKTSQAKILAKQGRELKTWVGFIGEFEILVQKIGQDAKEVIYIK